MLNINTAGSRSLAGVFFAVLFTLSGLASCGGGGGSTAVVLSTTTYTITASAVTNGTLTPAGITTLNQGASQTYTITPDTGYNIASLIVDGIPVTIASSYTFNSVGANHTINATFSPISATTFTITAPASIPNGTLTPAGVTTVNQGTTKIYTITPNSGYAIATLTVDSIPVSIASSYTFTNVQANHTISATFSALPTYTITASAPTHGTLTPTGVTTVNQGASQTYTLTPDSGYVVATRVIDGVPTSTTSTTYTFTNVMANHTIGATFSAAVSGGITPSVVPSRTSGVAPLSVFFDATGTTDTNGSGYLTPGSYIGATGSLTTFHDIEYSWNFGDGAAVDGSPSQFSSAEWLHGAKAGASKNSATGPLAAHVFETPGIYTVTMTAFDGTNSASITKTITVTDPNSYSGFAGTNTVCVSTSTDFTGCPSGATQHTTSSANTALGYITGSVKRLLFHAGQTWTMPSTGAISAAGPGYIGMFGTGAQPVINSTSSGANTFQFNSSTDWRILDLSLHGQYASGYGGGNGIFVDQGSQITILRLIITDYVSGFLNTSNGLLGTSTVPADQLTIQDCSGYILNTHNGAAATWGSGTHLVFQGNSWLPQGGDDHNLRIFYANQAIISNNTLGDAQAGAQMLKLHGANGVSASNENPWRGYYTQQVIVADNWFNSAGTATWLVTISPQNEVYDERLRDIIVERNLFTTSACSPNCGNQLAVLASSLGTLTIRNNIFNMTNMVFDRKGISVNIFGAGAPTGATPGADNPSDTRVYNNTFYASDADSGGTGGNSIGIEVTSSASNTVIKNNLMYIPTAASPTMYTNNGTGTVASNNSSNSQAKSTSPLFTTTPPVVTTDYQPTCTGTTYPCAQGTTVPVWSDFFLTAEPTTRDLGAANH